MYTLLDQIWVAYIFPSIKEQATGQLDLPVEYYRLT